MVLVDTSVWIDHQRSGDPLLERLLLKGQVLSHPFTAGELALGNLKQRGAVLDALDSLPRAVVASEGEVRGFIEDRKLFGLGIGYVNAHLIASTRLTPDALLWTRDKRLHSVAVALSLALVETE